MRGPDGVIQPTKRETNQRGGAMKITHALMIGCIVGFIGRGYVPISLSVGKSAIDRQIVGQPTSDSAKQRCEFRFEVSGEAWCCKILLDRTSISVPR